MMTQPNSKFYFVVESMEVADGRKLRAMTPDEDGYYHNVPLMMLGVPTLNGTLYDSKCIVDCITNPSSRFNIMLTSGTLYGEYDHPEFRGKEDIPRLLNIRRQFESHHIKKVSTVNTNEGHTLIVGSIKPTGPYGKYLDEDFRDPNRNTAFSVRSLCEEQRDPKSGSVIRKIRILVTFDAVSSPGFKQASKRYTPAVEKLELSPEDFPTYVDGVGNESSIITDKEFNSLFGAKAIRIIKYKQDITGDVLAGRLYYMDAYGEKRSILHSLLKRG
jgi:hypothetical protein